MAVSVLITFRPLRDDIGGLSSRDVPDARAGCPPRGRVSRELEWQRSTKAERCPPKCRTAILARPNGWVPLYIEALTNNVLGSELLTEGNEVIHVEGPFDGTSHS